MTRVYLEPSFEGEDPGDGGVRRVVEAQRRHLPAYDVELVAKPNQAEIIHCHIFPLQETKRFLLANPDIPLVIQSHGLYWQEYPDWPPWALKANEGCMEAIRLADHVTAPSEWVANSIRRNSLRPTTAIGHGIELEDWEPYGYKESYVLWNKTRVDPICDPEPVNRLARMMPKVKFVSTFGSKGIPNLELTGKLPYEEAKQVVQKAALYLCTARETFGIGTLEAMAAGCPVVGWYWGGQRQIVQHKETGWLSPPGNYDDLAEGIEYCFKHRAEMGAAARVEVEKRYQWKNVIGEYAKLYQRLLRQQPESNSPRVSIIVPAYGLEEFLPAALDSVKAQTYGDWECIVVDDASPDRCGEIAESYAASDVRYRVLHNKANKYLAGALNEGVGAAVGRYVLPLDADNLLPPQALELLATALDQDRSLHIAYGNVEFLKPDGRKWHSGWPPQFKAEWQVKRQESSERPNNLVPSGSMFRRQVWELTGGYRRRWQTAEDADFWTRATSYGFKAARITEADVLVYRDRPESMSRQHSLRDWTLWYPWSRELAAAPAAINFSPQVPVLSYEPILVSVVVPVGPGHEELVVDAIDSVDAQTFRLWECIVVNDTGGKLPNFPNWVKVVATRKRRGVSAARNLGLRHAQAKLFVPLDADDTLEPEALARMYEVWQEHRGYVYSDFYEKWDGQEPKLWELVLYRCGDCNKIGFKGERLNGELCPKCESGNTVPYKDYYDAQLLLEKGCLHAVTALYPMEAWQRAGGFDEKLPAWEDWDFQLKLANLGICGTRIPLPLFTYRKDTGMRREENYAAFETSKQGILDKWGTYFRGEETLMGCRGCPGGGGAKIAKRSQPAASTPTRQPLNEENFEIIEYVGDKAGALSYRGPSGQLYRFSSEERQKLVHKADVEHFLGFGTFRLVRKEMPVA